MAKSKFPLKFPHSFAYLRDILLSCTFAFQLSKVNPPLKSKDSKMCCFFQKVKHLALTEVYYKNDSREVPFTELPRKNYPSMSNLHRELPQGNCVHKIYIIQSAGC